MFSSIVTSSIWNESDSTRIVWITMLAMADADGIVEGTASGFAPLARVSIEQMEAAIETLSSPDRHSRTKDNEGRRIEIIEGGWKLLNYKLHRQKAQDSEGSRAPAMRAYRARKRQEYGNGNALPEDVTRYTPLQESVTGYTEERGERKEVRDLLSEDPSFTVGDLSREGGGGSADAPPAPPRNGKAYWDKTSEMVIVPERLRLELFGLFLSQYGSEEAMLDVKNDMDDWLRTNKERMPKSNWDRFVKNWFRRQLKFRREREHA